MYPKLLKWRGSHKTHSAPYNTVWFITTCSVVQLHHFASGFGWFGCNLYNLSNLVYLSCFHLYFPHQKKASTHKTILFPFCLLWGLIPWVSSCGLTTKIKSNQIKFSLVAFTSKTFIILLLIVHILLGLLY